MAATIHSVRNHLIDLLEGGNAHTDFDGAIDDLPPEMRGARSDKFPYTIWELVEHLRISQYDIVEFSRNPTYESPPWPKGYWPQNDAPRDEEEWEESLAAVRRDHKDMVDMVSNPDLDLFQPFAHGNGQTLMREALLVADHNAYHIGQIVLLRKLLGVWK